MLAKKLFGIPILAVLAAVVIGFLIGSIDRLRLRGGAELEPTEAISASAAAADRATEDASDVAAGHTKIYSIDSYTEPDSEFMSGTGALLRPARVNGVFVGFEILKSGGDKRLSDGSVIVAVNGMPVEDSAAGSEILAAALASDESQIVFAPKTR